MALTCLERVSYEQARRSLMVFVQYWQPYLWASNCNVSIILDIHFYCVLLITAMPVCVYLYCFDKEFPHG